ncbi:MAG: ABC transporter permease [Chloroflexi bacterium]|nr:ABC transporter permease [Chloroflexota bacterium]
MNQFVIRRLITTIPVLFGILVLTFVLLRAIPGDPCRAIVAERATEEVCDQFIESSGLNKSIPEQFLDYLNQVARGDLGTSFRHNRPVVDLFFERLPTTIELGIVASVFAVVVGTPLGIIAARRRATLVDFGSMSVAAVGVSTPVFLLGLLLAYCFGVLLSDTPFALPPSGRLTPGAFYEPFYVAWGLIPPKGEAFGFLVFLSRFHILNAVLTVNPDLMTDAIRHLILPAVTAGTIPLAIISRIMRSSLLDVLSQDYILTARSKGLSEFTVVVGHGVRNAMLPVTTVIGLSFGSLLSGAILTETVFGLPGVGQLVVEGIFARDYPVVQGSIMLLAFSFVFVNFVVDVSYAYLDPRVKLQ